MPVRVRIDLGGPAALETLWIGRMEGNEEPDSINTYVVGLGNENLEAWNRKPFDELVHFEHRYGDGLLVCVQKGINAYMASLEPPKTKPVRKRAPKKTETET